MISWLSSLRLLALMCLFPLASACTTTEPEAGYGIQQDHQSYVPARTAILPCRAWPNGARYKKLPLTSAKEEQVAALCAAVDAAVLDAFTNQPYMKGFTPKFAEKQLDLAGKSQLLSQLPTLWAHQASDCSECSTPPGYYVASLPQRTAWLAWLADLSNAVRNVDAVLLPFVTFAYDKQYDDRGLDVYERAAGVVLLLIDTASGELLWAGGREAQVPAKRLRSANVTGVLAPPDWRLVTERLLSGDLWREYPGRQTL